MHLGVIIAPQEALDDSDIEEAELVQGDSRSPDGMLFAFLPVLRVAFLVPKSKEDPG